MGLRPRAFLAAGLCVTAALVSACGSSQGLLTSHSHDQLSADLLAVRQAVDKGNCPDTNDALAELSTTLDGLPGTTNVTLRANLKQGYGVLKANALRQCHTKHKAPPVTTPTTPTTSSSSSTAATTTTAPASTTATTPPATTATTPPATTTGTTPASTATSGSTGTATSGNGGGGLTTGGQ